MWYIVHAVYINVSYFSYKSYFLSQERIKALESNVVAILEHISQVGELR